MLYYGLERHLLVGDWQQAVKVIFKITVNVKKLTQGATPYAEYDEFIKQRDLALKNLDNAISASSKKSEQKVLDELTEIEKKTKSLPKNPETVEDCRLVKETLAKFNNNFKVPSFDKPRIGTLYKVKNGWEYALKSENDIDAAEEEMNQAGIKNVEFVEQS